MEVGADEEALAAEVIRHDVCSSDRLQRRA